MLCELIASLLLCTAEPDTLRSEIIDYRINVAHTMPARPIYIEPSPQMKQRKRRGSITTAMAIAYAPIEPKKTPSFIERALKPSKPAITVTGIDMGQPGYKAVYAAAIKHGVDPNLALKVAWQESRGRCGETSRAGARGVMQVMPKTAKRHGVRNKNALYNCKTGAETGVKELKRLQNSRRTDGDLRKVLIGYNCGEGCLSRKRLPRETQNYIKKVTGKR